MPAASSRPRDLLFISYSHKDSKWLEWLRTFLKPYVQQGGLTVWADPFIRVGDTWRREISEALDSALVGALLVTQDFLASDFITQEELPALLRNAESGDLRLACIPVSSSTYKATRLQEFQWVRDPGQPLERLRKAERNRALVEITERLVALVAEQGATTRMPPEVTAVVVRDRPMAPVTISADRLAGDLHNVPRLPPHYRPREDDLARLKRSLVEKAAVGITAAPERLGLHGRGGIGKTVLAIALAADEEVRRAFPDGVYWVTAGQQPDAQRLQADLVRELTGERAEFTSVRDGTRRLEKVFATRSMLLILDDIWDAEVARAFDVLGEHGRLVLTTRDASIVTALGASQESIQRLSEPAALELLASWADVGTNRLPEAARRVAAECGYLPLALAAAGARVRDGASWADIADALEVGRLEFLNHPHASVFRSLRLSVDALPPDERQRYLELAVFPEDVQVPESVVLRLWKRTAGHDVVACRDLLTRFHNRALLKRHSDENGQFISLHDLQHDFLRLEVNDLLTLHNELLEGLATDVKQEPEGGPAWHGLASNDVYPWLYLGQHLAAASRFDELRALLLDARWLEAKLRTAGLSAVLSDFTLVPNDPDLALLADTIRLSAHIVSADPAQLPSQLMGRLLKQGAAIQRTLVSVGSHRVWLRPLVASLVPPGKGLVRTLTGHTSSLTAVAITPDGRHVVSGSADHTLKIWDLASGTELRTLPGHRSEVTAVAITSDGRHVLSSGDYTLKMWELASGTRLRTVNGETSYLTAVAITPEGRHAVSGAHDGTLKIWEVASGTELRTLTGHTSSVKAVAITPDGRHVVSGSVDHTLKIWDLASGTELRTLTGHTSAVRAVAITPDGRHVVSGSRDYTLKIWEVASGTELRTLTGHTSSVKAVAVTPDGRHVVSGSADHTLKIWDLASGTELRTLTGHTSAVTAVAITPDGRHVVSGSWDDTLKMWELASGIESRSATGHTGEVLAVAITPDSRHVVSSADHTLKIWDLASGAEIHTLAGHTGVITKVAITPDGRHAVSGAADGTLKIWELPGGRELRTLTAHKSEVTAVAITPDGRHAVSGAADETLKIWQIASGTELRTLSGHTHVVSAVAITPDGRHIVSGASDGTLKIWELASGAQLRTLTRHGDFIDAVVITPDGRHAISADGTLQIWELASGTKLRTLVNLMSSVTAVAITPDGRHVLCGASDGTLTIWELASGTELRTLTGHTSRVTAVAIMPGARYAVSVSRDSTVRLWNLEGGQLLATFTADGPLRRCVIARHGFTVVVADWSGRMHFLRVEGLEQR